MRPDTRSFSFTWLRGQKSTENVRRQKQQEMSEETVVEESTDGQSSSGSTGEDKSKDFGNNDSWGTKRGNYGSRLRRLGNSLTRLGGNQKYSNMEEDENWHKISEEPMPIDDDDHDDDDEDEELESFQQEMVRMKAMKGPDVIPQTTVPPIPFKPQDSNNVNSNETAPPGLSLTKRLNKTVQGVKTSLGNFSQKFRKSTRRRYRMGPGTPGSMASPTRRILGRTPTKLYSPFGIDSPALRKTPKRLADRPSTPRLARKSIISGLVYSPSNNFRRDLDEARRGVEDFQMITRDITRRSVRF